MALIRSSVITLGENKGTPRVYLQGEWLAKAGFLPSDKFFTNFEDGKVTLTLDKTGDRMVSGKKNKTIPVIDVQNTRLGEALKSASKIEVRAFNHTITITPAYTEILVAERRLTPTEGSLFSGGGFLSEAARQAGLEPRFAVEYDPNYAAVFEQNHPGAIMYNMSVEQVPFEELKKFRGLGVLTAGIPCEPHSKVRHWDKGLDANGCQIKRDRTLPNEAHENGDMAFWTLRAIEATNPHTVLMENVEGFLKSGSYFILENVLKRLGYFVDARIVNPLEYGELTSRKRAIIIVKTGSPVVWPEPRPNTRKLGEIFDPAHVQETQWFDKDSKAWLYEHWARHNAKGNGFASQQVDAESSSVGTITKRYFAGQGQHPVVKHPSKPDTHRWFSLDEVKRLHAIPDSYFVGDSKTLAGELIGQGVVVSTMREIIEANVQVS